jgi:hypothetical protein
MKLSLVLTLAIVGCSPVDDSGPDSSAAADLSVADSSAAPDLSDCPSYNPSSGAGAGGSCSRPDAYCSYFEAYCHCNLATSTWYCCDDGVRQQCPSAPPSGPDCCRAYPASCSYACVGGVATVCSCSDDRWQCSTEPCD